MAIYFILPHCFNSYKIQHAFLVLASLYFYAYFNFSYLKIILGSIIVNYLIAKMMLRVEGNVTKREEKLRKGVLIGGILFNVLLLGYYKCYDFFIENSNYLLGTQYFLRKILLPLGISFFTFQQLSFLISIYKRTEKLGDFASYCLFVTFFPQLVAGPIVLYSEMIPQFVDEKRRFFVLDNFVLGIYIFVIGLFKKVVVADTVAVFVDNGFGLARLGFAPAWIISLAYSLQLYFDFSGYSDMAIGMGKMFNINLPINFDSPYKSKSVTEFWRRWHITLGRALGAFVYIPLGGNRLGRFRTLINLMVVFLVSGLWHGADWTFVVWGALHGFMVAAERVLTAKLAPIPGFVRTTCTFLYINALWVLFRARSFDEAIKIYRGMLDFGNWDLASVSLLAIDGIVNLPISAALIYVLGSVGVLYGVVFYAHNSIERSHLFSKNYASMLLTSFLFVLSVVHMSRLSVFIYFNF